MPAAPATPSATHPAEAARPHNWAGEPILLLGEDARGFNELLARVERALKPRGPIEEMWMRDVVDLAWDVLRMRRMKASLLKANAREAVKAVIYDWVRDPSRLADQWSARQPGAVSQVETALDAAGMSMDTVMAVALGKQIDDIERIDGMIASAEKRRTAALLDLERHRASFAEQLRDALEQAQNADAPATTLAPQAPADAVPA